METDLPGQNPNSKVIETSNPKKHFYLYLGLILTLVVVIGTSIFGYFLFFNKKQPDSVIARVGQENIYQKDYDYEVSQLPPQGVIDKELLLQKMTIDSVILQGAAKVGNITLDSTIFNSLQKDYPKRISAVQTARSAVKERVTHIAGTAITLFFQNGAIGPLGYDKSKSLALAKISGIHKDLLNKKLTIEQAIEEIKTDKSLEQIDPAYLSNASFDFDSEKGAQATSVEELDELLLQQPENTVSDIFTDTGRNVTEGKEKESNGESYFIFAVVRKVIKNEDVANYDTWLAEQKKQYEVIYY